MDQVPRARKIASHQNYVIGSVVFLVPTGLPGNQISRRNFWLFKDKAQGFRSAARRKDQEGASFWTWNFSTRFPEQFCSLLWKQHEQLRYVPEKTKSKYIHTWGVSKPWILETDKEPITESLKWLVRYLRSSGIAGVWSTFKNVLKDVVSRHLDYSDAQEIQRRLDGVTDCCTCANNEVRINEMVKILEEEYVSAHDIYLWVIEVLQDARLSRSDLVPEIRSRVPPAPGPVYWTLKERKQDFWVYRTVGLRGQLY